ncbi:hypothetical protein ASY01nite_05270 [Acetobacter syzygii]|uniref:hypothetical protein n=1 Tax=Acetobacter syzygii TaxID=146476 RepID=UPI0005E2D2EE|nr:hypothetical protein [Acetobacter syzygii]GAN70652.1 hypothetical protein Absy_008_165 [Acetobacter syzygii]GBR65630.1 hypothetical protein AA0483_1943 [Acetobacter syzygii NRIC 0483]GEL55461.1 hypothetical protein ASY01nite_05270 [Acetobacter syzygii]
MTDDKDFALWLAKEKKALADAGYREVARAFHRVKGCLASALVLTVTLTSASVAGACSQREYSLVCGFLALGFAITGGLCAVGLYSGPLLSKNVGPEGVDTILSDVPTRDEAQASLWLAYTVFFITGENSKLLGKGRRWLRAAWISLSLTPPVAFVLAVACGAWSAF